MEKKKSWILRPIAWICTVVMSLCIEFISELICKLGQYLVYWLGTLPTIAIILLTMAFGSLFVSLVYLSARFLPVLLVYLSDKIYPSNHAFRYYFVGIISIALYALVVWGSFRGIVAGGSMLWLYIRAGYLTFAAIMMMVHGHIDAEERHRES